MSIADVVVKSTITFPPPGNRSNGDINLASESILGAPSGPRTENVETLHVFDSDELFYYYMFRFE